MTRRFLDTIRADIAAQLADNSTGDITAPIMQTLLVDMIDSTIQDEASINSNTLTVGFPTTTAFTSFTTGIYDDTTGGDANFLNTDAINGSITSSAIAGWTYSVRAKASIEGINQNTPIEFSIMADGVPVGFVAAATGGHGDRPLSVDVAKYDLTSTASTVYTLGVRTPDGAEVIDIISIGLGVAILPTNNP